MTDQELTFDDKIKLVLHFVDMVKDITTKIAIECAGEFEAVQLASNGDGDSMMKLEKEGINIKKIHMYNEQRSLEIVKMNNILNDLQHHELN